MAITLGDAFQNWNPDTKLATGGAKVDGGVIAMLEPNIFRNKVMLPGVTFATDVESLMVDNRFAVAFIRKLDKVKVTLTKATADGAFRVVPTQSDGDFIEVKCNDVLKVAEVVNEPIDEARVSGRTAERVALASESYDEIKELRYLSYLINGGGSPDATDVGAPASANTTRCTKDTVLDNIIDDRATLRKAGADPDTLIISEDTDAVFLKYIGATISALQARAKPPCSVRYSPVRFSAARFACSRRTRSDRTTRRLSVFPQPHPPTKPKRQRGKRKRRCGIGAKSSTFCTTTKRFALSTLRAISVLSITAQSSITAALFRF